MQLSRVLKLPEVGMSTREVRRQSESLRNDLPDIPPRSKKHGLKSVEAQKISLSYDGKLALQEISITLRGGEITALMGRNGAGKSSLIRCITGIQETTTGSISIGEELVQSLSPRERARKIGYIPQDPGDILYRSSVSEECAQGDKDNSLPTGTTLELLHRTLPTIAPSTHPRDLSEGERLTLVLSIVLAASPSIVILDEPTRGLDYEAKSALSHQLRQLADIAGATILIATHDVELVAEIADRTVFLADGEKVADGPTIDVLLASPAFAPQVAKVMSPRKLLTVSDVIESVRIQQVEQ